MAAESTKRINCVKACFTDREFIDLGRISAREDRKVADMVWVLVRRAMYGMVSPPVSDEQDTDPNS
jgi:hypothetical protein